MQLMITDGVSNTAVCLSYQFTACCGTTGKVMKVVLFFKSKG